jgi:FXSXX-COOH protein
MPERRAVPHAAVLYRTPQRTYAAHVEEPEFPPLPDLSGVSIAELRELAGDGVFERALKRVLAELDDPNGVISAFGSYVGD